MPPKVLITGAAGFLGSHVAEHCLRLGFEVVAVDDLSGGFEANVPEGARFVRGSVTDGAFVRALFDEHRFAFVYHLAAYAAEGLSHFVRRFNYETNLVASVLLINEAVKHDVECFVFTSSIAVYGGQRPPMTEETPPRPEDPYGISKFAVELDLEAARRMFGLNYVVFRPHNVYGERQHLGDRHRNVIGIFMNQAMRGEPMTVFGDGNQTRAFSYVADVAPVIAESPRVAGARNEVFNLGTDHPCTVLEVAAEVARAFGVARDVVHLEAREEVVHAYATHAKLARVFGPQPNTPLREGIARMAAWARARGPVAPVRFEAIEVTKNLPPSWRR